jgi:hypothetical protein
MTTYYVDPAAGGANDGTSWIDAWTTFQSALDTAVAGDTVRMRGTETLAAKLDADTNSGTTVAGYIKYIGCNGAGSIDGTRFVIDANSAAANCIDIDNQDYLWFENIEFKNATGDGVYAHNTAVVQRFINCDFNNNGGRGLYINSNHSYTERCLSYSNSDVGIEYGGDYHQLFFSAAYANGDNGVELSSTSEYCFVYGIVCHDNGGTYQLQLYGDNDCIFAVIDGTGHSSTGVYVGARGLLLGTRIVNNNVGVNFGSVANWYGWNYFHGNTTDTQNDGSTLAIPYDSDTDTNEADVDADDGLNDIATHDFRIKNSRTLRRTAIDLNIGT